MLDHDNSAFLCIRSLRGTVHSMAQFLRKFLQMMIKVITVFLLTLEVVLEWMRGGQNLHVYNLFHYQAFCKDGRIHLFYYATISCNNKNYKPKLYKGSCETSFKKCYSNHKKYFNIPLYKHDTKLSTEYSNLKMEQLNPQISWKINIQVLYSNFKTL